MPTFGGLVLCYGLGSAPIRNSQLDNQLIAIDTILPTRQPARKQTAWWFDRANRHRFLEPIHNVKEGPNAPHPRCVKQRETDDLHPWKILIVAHASVCRPASRSAAAAKAGGAYRDRTDDPLLAKQVLSQLS